MLNSSYTQKSTSPTIYLDTDKAFFARLASDKSIDPLQFIKIASANN